MQRIKIAHIGTNGYSHANQVFRSIAKQTDIFDLVGYVLPENERELYPKKCEIFNGYTELTLDEVLNDPEITAVSVETDEIHLTKYALLAAKHGKHIHMEKPGGRELPDFEKLIDTVKKNNTVFHIGYMYRYNPYVIDALERVKKGELGEIVSVEAQMSCYHPAKTRDWLNTFDGGMMFYLGCHLVDLVLQFCGKPDRILPFNKRSMTEGVDSPDFSMALFEYKNGVSFIKTTACEIGGYNRRQFVITGTEGTIELKPFEMVNGKEINGLYTCRTEYHTKAFHSESKSDVSPIYDRYDSMIAAFGRMCAGEINNPYTYDYELELYKTLLKCCKE